MVGDSIQRIAIRTLFMPPPGGVSTPGPRPQLRIVLFCHNWYSFRLRKASAYPVAFVRLKECHYRLLPEVQVTVAPWLGAQQRRIREIIPVFPPHALQVTGQKFPLRVGPRPVRKRAKRAVPG